MHAKPNYGVECIEHINELVTVFAKVYGTKDFTSMIFVDLGAGYPDSPLTVVLKDDAKKLSADIDGKNRAVTGKIIEFKGKPEIIVTDKSKVHFYIPEMRLKKLLDNRSDESK